MNSANELSAEEAQEKKSQIETLRAMLKNKG